jgi:Cys-tRNA(Pro)/Cys-tRNA(Cys) deacylase
MPDEEATPATPATEALRGAGLAHRVVVTPRARSAEESAAFQGVPVNRLLKSLVVRRGEGDYVFVLVPGDRQIDWRKLRAHLGVSRLSLPDRDEARRVTGYEPGAITPFGSATALPVIVDSSAAGEGTVTVGGGAHGVNIHVDGLELVSFLDADTGDVTSPSIRK